MGKVASPITVVVALAIAFFGQRGLLLAVILMTAVIVVFCEILPKTLAIAYPEKVLLLMLPALRGVAFLLATLVLLTQAVIRGLGRLMGIPLENRGAFVTRQEIDHLVKAMDRLWSHCALNRQEMSA